MNENKNIKWNLLLKLVYLNTALLFFVFQLYTFFKMGMGKEQFTTGPFMFLILSPVLGFLIDEINKNRRFVFLRFYSKIIKFVFVILFLFIVTVIVFPQVQTFEVLVFGIVFSILLLSLFYVPINACLDFLANSKQFPLVVGVLASTSYSVFMLNNELLNRFYPQLGFWYFLLLAAIVFHAGVVFRKAIKVEQLFLVPSDTKKTSWNRIIWVAIMLGFGHVSLLYLYPKFYLMLNEPHGVSKVEAKLFGELIFYVSVVLLLPLGYLVSRLGVIRIIKINNTVLILSLLSAVFFPDYFYIEIVVSIISLSLAVVTNLPVVYDHLSNKNRGAGVGLFFGIVTAMVAFANLYLSN